MAASAFSDLLAAVRATVSLAVTLAPEQIRVRRRLAFRKGNDDLPLLVIYPEAERVADYQMNNGVWIDYPVSLALVSEDGLELETDVTWLLDRREEIRKALHVDTFAAASKVFQVVGYEPMAPYPPGAVDQAFDVSVQRFTYRTTEART